MRDSWNREIRYLRLSVTERCNLRCRYCMPEAGICKKSHAEMLTEEEMIGAVEAAASLGFHKVRITGGEPLVKRNILSICEKTAGVNGIREVCMTTNGILLPGMARDLLKAGVIQVNLSLDTLDPEKYRQITRVGCLEDALRGLEAAVETGFRRVKVNAVLIGGFNDNEIGPLAELTRRYPVDVRFIELMPMLEDPMLGPDAFISGDKVLSALPELTPWGEEGVARLYRLPGGLGSVGVISSLSAHFCGRCDRVRLTADGRLKPCLHGPEEYPIKGLPHDEVVEQFKRAIENKPCGHGALSARDRSRAGRTMNQIGG